MYQQVVVDTADKPGIRDRANFDLHWSVDYWQNFTLPPAIEDTAAGPIPSRHVHASVKALPEAGGPAPPRRSPISARDSRNALIARSAWLLMAVSITLCHDYGPLHCRAAARLACVWQARRLLAVTQQRCQCTHCESLSCRLQAIVKTLSDAASTAGVFSSSKAAAYWSYHITRSGFFAIQGIAGTPPS